MSRIDFYHLQKQKLEDVLPKLLEKVLATGKKIKVKVGNEMRVEFLNSLLWTYQEESFLPHGSVKDGMAELQPVWLSAEDANLNQAQMLFLVDGALINPETANNFERVFNIFDGQNEEALSKARDLWRMLRQNGSEMHYWQQENSGRWIEK